MKIHPLIAVLLVVAVAGPAAAPVSALTFVKLTDHDLAAQADLVVEARVLEVDRAPGIGRAVTDYRFAVERVVAGAAAASPLVVRVPGGELDSGALVRFYGAPSFANNERALLFLRARGDGTYRILHVLQGAFRIVEAGGRAVAVRDFSGAEEVAMPGREKTAERPRDLARFRAWLADRARGVERAPDYLLDAAELPALSKFTILRDSQNRILRWREFDTGGSVRFSSHRDGHPGLPGGGVNDLRSAINVWNNDPDTPIRYVYGGTTGASGGLGDCDGTSAVLWNDPNGDLDEPFTCAAGGTLAAARSCVFVPGNHTYNGMPARTLAEGDVVTNRGAECWLSRNRGAAEVMTHELGHTLGLGHSCGDGDSGSCNTAAKRQATMRAQAHGDGRGARLMTDDRAGIRFLYGDPEELPAAPSNLRATAVSGAEIRLDWNDNSGVESSFRIERRTGNGGFSEIASVGADVTTYRDRSVGSGMTYTYRVRARNAAGPSPYSNQATRSTPGELAPSNLVAAALSSSQILLEWRDNSATETSFLIEIKTASSGFTPLKFEPANAISAVVDNLDASTTYTFRVRATGGAGDSSYSNEASATTLLGAPEPCVADQTTLCLNQGRFRVRVTWRDFDGNFGPARDAGLVADDSGLFWFFAASNWEMLVKVLDGCNFNDRFWVFAAATTNVEYRVEVFDSATGLQQVYENPLGVSSPAIIDTDAFAVCPAPAAGQPPAASAPARVAATPVAAAPLAATPVKQGSCTPAAGSLCLRDGRFRVEVDWQDFDGNTGTGTVDPLRSDDSGLFWFFAPENLELLVKVLDGCGFNQRIWVFLAGVTTVDYTLRVTDTETGQVRSYRNPLGRVSPAITDTDAFAACP